MTKDLTIPFEVADGIALAVMKEQRKYLQSEINNHYKKGKWLHPDDIVNNMNLIEALDRIIKYFGG